ncbi:hypothetical protein BY458DRAFT_519600 [Sporodiniella umbellata]|nr:hypothetical protein BY458DRAFT_519600 [Sporodiniella umbellata]
MSFTIFSGGTACNNILESFHRASEGCQVSYILGISDNGGSTSEILRVLGGPSVGDLRSRLLKLMDVFDTGDQEMAAIKRLLSYRLPIQPLVYEEWLAILSGTHKLWDDISTENKRSIRRFLTLFDIEIHNKKFNFSYGSIGNFLLTGARIYTGSLDSALLLCTAILKIPKLVVPIIDSNHTSTIAATLANGTTLLGQCEISHPATPTKECDFLFSKQAHDMLDSPIKRIFYTDSGFNEIYPTPNPQVIRQLSSKHSLVYSIGSLYTSLIPCLVLRSIGNAIAHSKTLKYKILMLNGFTDRETYKYNAMDFVRAITEALHESQRIDCSHSYMPVSGLNTPPASPTHESYYKSPVSSFITHFVYLDNSSIPVDVDPIKELGIQCVSIKGALSDGKPVYNQQELTNFLQSL